MKRTLDICLLSDDIFVKYTGETLKTFEDLKKTIAEQLIPSPPMTVNKLQFKQFCTLGDGNLNDLTGGGLPTQMITEIYGPAGCGKTQFALQLALQAQLPLILNGFNTGKEIFQGSVTMKAKTVQHE